MPTPRKVVYIELDEDDKDNKSIVKRVNSEWVPIYWLIEVLVGPDDLIHTEQAPGLLHKYCRLLAVDQYLKSIDKNHRPKALLKKVVEHNHSIMPEANWRARANEIEEGVNYWDMQTSQGIRWEK